MSPEPTEALEALDALDALEAPASAGAPHEHAHRLVAVHLEDRTTTRELVCDGCGAVWFT